MSGTAFTRVDALIGQARRAGASGAEGFADWLILDEEWFGPCTTMDTPTYQRWRRRAQEIYHGPRDAYVSAVSRTTSWTVELPDETTTHSEPAAGAVRAAVAVLIILLFMVLMATAGAVAGDPEPVPPSPQEPTSRASEGAP